MDKGLMNDLEFFQMLFLELNSLFDTYYEDDEALETCCLTSYWRRCWWFVVHDADHIYDECA